MRGTAKLANASWEALLKAHAVLMKEFIARDDWREISMREYDVLYTLSKQPGPVRVGDLAERVLLSQPAISRMVNRLVRDGLVRRQTDPSDARGVLVSLTEDGRSLQRQVGRAHARSVTDAMSTRLNAEDMRELLKICAELAGEKA